MIHFRFCATFMAACVLIAAYSGLIDCPAQESNANTAQTPQATQASTPTAAQRFAQMFDEWKQLLVRLRDLRRQYQIAEEAEIESLRGQWQSTLEQVHRLLPQMRAAAVDAYREAPNADRELTKFLVKLVEDDLQADRYEDARNLTELLIQNGVDDRKVFDLAGIAAFCVQDFDAAKQYLQEADARGVLSQTGKEYYAAVDKVQKLWQEELAIRERERAADDLPRVELETTKGRMVLELFENEAPETVGNFVHLVDSGFYDGLTFHRVLPGFMAQGGCPKGDGTGGPGYTIYCECHQPNHRNHFRGSVSMAHAAGRNTGGSQFFIMFRPDAGQLNGQYTVFGRVIKGIEVLSEIQRRDPDKPEAAKIEPDKIVKATVLRKRDHKYVPNKVQ